MRKLSEIKGEDALDVLADLLEPVSEIFTDEEFVGLIRNGKKLKAAMVVLKKHKEPMLKVLAILDGKNPDEYNPSIIELPVLILNLLNDPDLIPVFQLADPVRFSGSAMVSTGETGGE